MYYTIMKTHMCNIILAGDERGLAHLHLDTGEGRRTFHLDERWERNNDFFKEIIGEIEEYFKGERKAFTIKLSPGGTEYQRRVWEELRRISYGEVKTYKEIAETLGKPKAARSVGMANSKNPLPLIIPCHRVVGTGGKLTGFAHGLEIKEKLINFERMISIYHKLLNYYGYRGWWPAETDYEMMAGAVLTQNTSWKNVQKAIENLKGNLNPADLLNLEDGVLAALIKPSGYYNQKSVKLKALTRWYERYAFDINLAGKKSLCTLRGELLDIYGVGGETADCILTYALKKPSFIIDTYTRRLFKRLGFTVPKKYDDFKKMIEVSMAGSSEVYGEYHALIVEHSKRFCSKVPSCEGCPLYQDCTRDI